MVKNYQTAREGNEKKGPDSLKEINWISELLSKICTIGFKCCLKSVKLKKLFNHS